MIKKKLNISSIDMTIMHDIFGNNVAAMQDYLENFIKVTSELLEKAGVAIRQKDSQSALGYYHKLKSPIGSIKFNKLYRLCEKTEKKIEESDWDSADKLYMASEEILKKLEMEVAIKFKDR